MYLWKLGLQQQKRKRMWLNPYVTFNCWILNHPKDLVQEGGNGVILRN